MIESTGKVLIIGAGGRMGAALARHCAHAHSVIPFRRQELDVLKLDHIRPCLAPIDFDALVYTAGITNVDYCEDHPEEARICNALTPKLLAEICRTKGARFIHVSTDYVFDGMVNKPLNESHPPRPLSIYGASKLEGEEAVLSVSPEFLVIRVSWLFGPDRPSFPDMIIKNALAQEHVSAIADKVSCPTYSEDLARWIEPMLFSARFNGLLHLSNSGGTNWCEYGKTALEMAAALGLPVKTRHVHPLLRADFPLFKAVRPEFTAFDTGKFTTLSNITPRPWQEALREYIELQYVKNPQAPRHLEPFGKR